MRGRVRERGRAHWGQLHRLQRLLLRLHQAIHSSRAADFRTKKNPIGSGERLEHYDGLIGARHNGFGDGDELLLLIEHAKARRAR